MKSFFTTIFLIFSFVLSAQFSTSVELKYLEKINNSDDVMLHRQNWHNAELVCDSLIIKQGNPLGAKFLNNLTISYVKGGNYSMAAFTFIRQQCIYPCDSVDAVSKAAFNIAASHLNLTATETQNIIDAVKHKQLVEYRQALRKVIVTVPDLKTKETDKALLHLIRLYNMLYPDNHDIVIDEIEYLVTYNIPVKYRKISINREATDINDWKNNLDKKILKVFLKREIRLLRKYGAKKQIKTIRKKLKEL